MVLIPMQSDSIETHRLLIAFWTSKWLCSLPCLTAFKSNIKKFRKKVEKARKWILQHHAKETVETDKYFNNFQNSHASVAFLHIIWNATPAIGHLCQFANFSFWRDSQKVYSISQRYRPEDALFSRTSSCWLIDCFSKLDFRAFAQLITPSIKSYCFRILWLTCPFVVKVHTTCTHT